MRANDAGLPPSVRISVRTGHIVADRFDAGISSGATFGKYMIAVRIGPDLRMAAVASPVYLAGRQAPAIPRDVADHRCITSGFRRIKACTSGRSRGGGELSVRGRGQVVVNDVAHAHRAALDGTGTAYRPEDHVADDLAERQLIHVLADWGPPFPGYPLYHSSRQ